MSENQDFRPSGRYEPISAWGYVGYNILFCIPVIGLIFLIVFTFSSKNINRRSYARSFWCTLLLSIIVWVIVLTVSGIGVSGFLQSLQRAH